MRILPFVSNECMVRDILPKSSREWIGCRGGCAYKSVFYNLTHTCLRMLGSWVLSGYLQAENRELPFRQETVLPDLLISIGHTPVYLTLKELRVTLACLDPLQLESTTAAETRQPAR